MTRQNPINDPLPGRIVTAFLVITLLSLITSGIFAISGQSYVAACLLPILSLVGFGVFIWLNSRFRSNPEVKAKLALEERIRIHRGHLQTQANKILAADQNRDKLKLAEQQEHLDALNNLQIQYAQQQLSAASLDSAKIIGIGPKLKEILAANNIHNAADIPSRGLSSIDGIGSVKNLAIMAWRAQILVSIEVTKPRSVTPEYTQTIIQAYQQKQTANDQAQQAAQAKKIGFEKELTEMLPDLENFKGLTLWNYLNRTISTGGMYAGLFAIILILGQFCLLGAIPLSKSASLAASAPFATAADIFSIQTQAVQTIVAGITSSAPTLTPQSSATIALTETPAPTLAPTSTADPAPILTTAQPAASTGGDLRYHFIDVGQGDSALIQSPDGWNILIDGGEAGSGAAQYLQSLGITHLNLVVATHPHSDHIGGLVNLIQTFQVDKVINNGQTYTTAAYNNFLDTIIFKKIPYLEVKRGDTISAGILSFQVLNPTGAGFDSNPNENSIVLKFTYGKTTFLLMGDASQNSDVSLLYTGIPLKADILKVGHHGSATGTTPAFLQAVKPAVAIYSAGINNSYDHPAPYTISNLTNIGAQIYGTDINGTIIITINSDGYTINAANATKSVTIQPTAPPAAAAPSAAPPPVGIGTLEILSITNPVGHNAVVTLSAKTTPGASCTIVVRYKTSVSTALGLYPKTADSSGQVSWSWQIGSNTSLGTWPATVTCNGVSQTEYFTVQ